MKKIVTTIAALAMAVSMFAADVSAKIEVLGDVMNYDAKTKTFNLFGMAEGGRPWNPILALSASGDKAGGSMSFIDNGAGSSVTTVDYSVWFKPFDGFTVNVGKFATNLNQETIDYSESASGIDTDGVTFSYAKDAFSADIMFVTPWSNPNYGWNRFDGNDKFWLTKAGSADAVVGETFIKLQYAADFGTINAYADLNTSVENSDWSTGTEVKTTYPGHDFGIGYKNTFGSVTTFFNGLFGFDKDFNFGIFRGELYATTGIDAFGISAFIAGGYSTDVGTCIAKDKIGNVIGGDQAFVGATMKITYAAGAVTPYIYFKNKNFLADDFSMIVKPGIAGSVGSMSYDLAVEITAQKDIQIDVPVTFVIAF